MPDKSVFYVRSFPYFAGLYLIELTSINTSVLHLLLI